MISDPYKTVLNVKTNEILETDTYDLVCRDPS